MNTALARYVGLLLARWRWVVWGVLLGLLVTTVVLLVKPPVYRCQATVFVRTPGDISRVQDGGDLYARARAETYAALATSTSVSARVIADLGLDLTPETLARRIAADPRPGTALLDLSVSAPSAAEALRTTTVLLAELDSTVQHLESTPGGLVPRAELVVVDPPRPPVRVTAFGLSVPAVLLAVTLLGALLGALAAVIRFVSSERYDDSLANPDDDSGSVGVTSSSAGSESMRIENGALPLPAHRDGVPDAEVGRRAGRHRRPRRGVPAKPAEGHE
jgi:hypothetical protein